MGEQAMPRVIWDPEDRKPGNAAALEAEIERVAQGAQVKLTLRDEAWLVRALAPAAFCGRGHGFSGRDLSETIAELLEDNELPVRVKRSRVS